MPLAMLVAKPKLKNPTTNAKITFGKLNLFTLRVAKVISLLNVLKDCLNFFFGIVTPIARVSLCPGNQTSLFPADKSCFVPINPFYDFMKIVSVFGHMFKQKRHLLAQARIAPLRCGLEPIKLKKRLLEHSRIALSYFWSQKLTNTAMCSYRISGAQTSVYYYE